MKTSRKDLRAARQAIVRHAVDMLVKGEYFDALHELLCHTPYMLNRRTYSVKEHSAVILAVAAVCDAKELGDLAEGAGFVVYKAMHESWDGAVDAGLRARRGEALQDVQVTP